MATKNFASRVNELVVSNLLSAGVDSSRLVEFLNSCGCDTDKMLRIALYINGTIDAEKPKECVFNPKKNHVLLMTKYDFFNNVVSYETSYETTRWFSSEERAKSWASESRPYAYSGESRETECARFPMTAKVTESSSMSFEDWEALPLPTPEQLEEVAKK